MNGNQIIEAQMFDTVPDVYPYEGRPILLLAWRVPDGFWRWAFGSFYEYDGYRTWEPHGRGGIAATEALAQTQCRQAVNNRNRHPWTAPVWAINGGAR